MVRSEALKQAQKRYRIAHKDELREYKRVQSKKFYARHKDEINAKRREKYKAKKESEKI